MFPFTDRKMSAIKENVKIAVSKSVTEEKGGIG